MDFSCTVCDLNFLTKGERKIHILSDKHQSNARRRLKVTYGRIRETSVLVESKVPMMPVTAGILELMEQLPRITGEDFAKDFIISATTPTKAVWILSDMRFRTRLFKNVNNTLEVMFDGTVKSIKIHRCGDSSELWEDIIKDLFNEPAPTVAR